MMTRTAGYWILALLAITGAVFLVPDIALAQAAGSAGPFTCLYGQAAGQLYSTNPLTCPTTLSFDHLFSFLICNMEQLSGNLLGNMFCGMMYNLEPAVSAVLLLAVVIFATGFTIGVIPATARELQVFLLKVAFVWAFATQSEYLLEYGYKFLVDGTRDSVSLVLAGMSDNNNSIPYSYQAGMVDTNSTAGVYARFDQYLGNMLSAATSYVTGSPQNNTNTECKGAIFSVVAIMAVAFPPIFFLAIALILRIILTFLRAVFGYIYAIVGIAFLLTLAPFFLSFYLFRQTRPFFDKWLGYIVSFALQIVIVFSFLAFVVSVDTSSLTSSFTDIVVRDARTVEGGSFRMPWDYCTVCDFEVVDALTGLVVPEDRYGAKLATGKMRCVDHRNDQNPPQNMDPATGFVPMGIDNAVTPGTLTQKALVKFAGMGMLALIVLAYVLESVIAYAGSLAQMLAGGLGSAYYAPQLVAGANPSGRAMADMPFSGSVQDFESGFDRGFATQSNGASGVVEAFKNGMKALVTGENYAVDREGRFHRDETGKLVRNEKGEIPRTQTGGGVKNRFMEWLIDPNRMDQ